MNAGNKFDEYLRINKLSVIFSGETLSTDTGILTQTHLLCTSNELLLYKSTSSLLWMVTITMICMHIFTKWHNDDNDDDGGGEENDVNYCCWNELFYFVKWLTTVTLSLSGEIAYAWADSLQRAVICFFRLVSIWIDVDKHILQKKNCHTKLKCKRYYFKHFYHTFYTFLCLSQDDNKMSKAFSKYFS